eukprot:4519416-Pyramimonas_sp.AAC.1
MLVAPAMRDPVRQDQDSQDEVSEDVAQADQQSEIEAGATLLASRRFQEDLGIPRGVEIS